MKALQIRQRHLAAQNAAKGLGDNTVQEIHEQSKKEDEALAPDKTEALSVEGLQEVHSKELQSQELQAEVTQPEDREAAKDTSHGVQDSPISAPEPSDGLSTQASSITEDEIPIIHKQDMSEAKMIPDEHNNRSGLEDIMREQTQGSFMPTEAGTHEPPEEIPECPIPVNLISQEDKSAQPSSPVRDLSSQAVEANKIRDGAKPSSIASASSEHTVTDEKIPLPAETTAPAEDVPSSDVAEAPSHGSNPIKNSKTIPLRLGPSETPKQASEEVSVFVDAEEPESPFLIEDHSVQTSASPSVVNLLDGLAATTHNESTLSAGDIETVAPKQAQQPSLFNMVGGFGESEDSIESPLSAVREEAETAPSPNQSDYQALHTEDSSRKTQMPLHTSARDHTQIEGLNQPSNVEDEPLTTKQAQTPNVKETSQVAEASPTESAAIQKTRPRTTSKTFQFPSKSRSLSRGEKPPSLDLPRDTEHTQDSSHVRLSYMPDNSTTTTQLDTKPKEEQKITSRVQPEAQPASHPTTQSTQSINANPEEQPGSQSPGMPVPDALSHASSKALKLLGFSAGQSEPQPDVRAGQFAGSKTKEVQAQAYSEVQTEALTDVKPNIEVDTEPQGKLLPDDRSEGFLNVHPNVPPESQVPQSIADAFTSNLTKAIKEDKEEDRQARRRGIVEPVKRVSTPEQSDEHFLSDDSFMEELKTATVQEAKPISVSRSPIKPGFLGYENELKAPERRNSRIVSGPLDPGISGERSASSTRQSAAVSLRSFSGTILPRPDVKTPPGPQSAQPKKFGVSSGISQRIKALEVKSSRPNSPNLPTPTTPGFLNLRKPSFNSELNGARSRSRASTAYPSPQTSPEIGKSDPLNPSTTPRGETVSVTATIVRDPADKSPRAPRDATNPPRLTLHESPLVVEHQVMSPPKQQVMGPPQFSPLKPPRPRYSRYSSARSASSSSIEQKAAGTPRSRRDSTASKRSGRSSRNGSEVDLPRVLSDRSMNSNFPLDGIKEEKKGSRSSRLLKRMSSITSISRRSIAQTISPSPREGSIMEHEQPIAETSAFSEIDIGDINIQFPDTLLWKRRHMTINEMGIVELSASKADNVCSPQFIDLLSDSLTTI